MKPVLVNPNSNFVVVTYWWGRGVINRNMQRPCPSEIQPGDTITQEGITYDAMIRHWEKTCKKAKCNYMAIEKPEYAKKGMYQKAINYKPDFIKEALEACAPRAVLYIDGDMNVLRYPCIFDMKGIDYMGTGWNIDGRKWGDVCYDPYILEVSGGTMYFGQTYWSHRLLDTWITETRKSPKKADDRIISQLFNNKQLLVPMTIIQLPLEYLWLNLLYDDSVNPSVYKERKILIEHPECLTSEENAEKKGADSDRHPVGYNEDTVLKIRCIKRPKTFYIYEKLWFNSKGDCTTMGDLTRWLSSKKIAQVIPYKNGFGDVANSVLRENIQKSKTLKLERSKSHKLAIVTNRNRKGYSKHKEESVYIVDDMDMSMAAIYGFLNYGLDVIVLNNTNTIQQGKVILEEAKKIDISLAARNKNTYDKFTYAEYTLKVDTKSPIIIRANSPVLQTLVGISKNWKDFQKHFNSSYDFISRIRCHWYE